MTEEEAETITLSDIETMISILERFIRISKRAERIVRQLAPARGGGQQDFMKQFMAMAYERGMAKQGLATEEYEEEALDEETKRVIEKIRAKKQVESQKQAQK